MGIAQLAGFAADGTADPRTARRVGEVWVAGGLAALPTETVYGLAADAQDEVAVARIYQAKGRPADHPLIVHVADAAALAAWSDGPAPLALALAEAFWPGPLTLVVRRGQRAGDHLTGGQDTVALRSPGHPVALACLRALAELTGDPARGVAAPSANRFGRVSPTSAADVAAELADRLDPDRDVIVDGGVCAVGLESTIVDCTAVWQGRPRPRVLRPGAISQAQIDEALAQIARDQAAGAQRAADRAPIASTTPGSGPDRVDPLLQMGPDPAGSAGSAGSPGPRAPGMLASHYAPAADVVVLPAGAPLRLPEPAGQPENPITPGLIGMDEVATPPGWVRLAAPTTVEEYAHALYAALRRADTLGLPVVVAVLPAGDGPLAGAIADRLGRAAHVGPPGSGAQDP